MSKISVMWPFLSNRKGERLWSHSFPLLAHSHFRGFIGFRSITMLELKLFIRSIEGSMQVIKFKIEMGLIKESLRQMN